MTNRANKAVEILKSGGYFRKALEASRPGWGEKFKTHLFDASGQKVRGIGASTRHELESAKLLARRDCTRSSTFPEEWILC